MSNTQITSTTIKTRQAGIVGELSTIALAHDDILIFQMPRTTEQMSRGYIEQGQKALEAILPDGKQALIIGSDVDLFAITGATATQLKLQGKI